MMILVKAIVRPEKKDELLAGLSNAGFHAATVLDVVGRGKQMGIKVGGVVYDEIPKSLIMMVASADDKDNIVKVILKHAKSGDTGAFGDGKIFISPVEAVYTISSGATGL
ncbi:nitrogen regulatory protein PII 1 [Sporomusaceae bacterium BoRhaA]|nr:nitrogen regulatory protein PII 1 [Pelorhabdus rhamnosifermentans]